MTDMPVNRRRERTAQMGALSIRVDPDAAFFGLKVR